MVFCQVLTSSGFCVLLGFLFWQRLIIISRSICSKLKIFVVVAIHSLLPSIVFSHIHFLLVYLCLVPRLPPRNIILSTTGSRSLLLSWDHLSKNDTNGIIINYSVCTQKQGASTPICVNVSATDNSYAANGLKPYSNYTVTIAAINSAGFGPYNSGITKQTNEEGKYFTFTFYKVIPFELFSYNIDNASSKFCN